MSRRCSSCNLLCSVEQGEPELNLDIEGDGSDTSRITGDVRMTLTSACCGDEVAEATADVDIEVDHPHNDDKEKHELEVVNESAEAESRSEGKGRRPRTYYGARVSVELKCKCGWTGEVEQLVEEQASGYENIN